MPISSVTNQVVQSIAIIPARGGSKGIPGKNIKLLAGRPLISYTIAAAQRAARVASVHVSTDSPEIARVAEACGAHVIWRPAEISGDFASSEAALLHALDQLETEGRLSARILTFLQCTSPLTRAADIDGAIESLTAQGADTCVAAAPFHYFLWEESAEGAKGINHDKRGREMRQQRAPQYLESGSIYVMNIDGFRRAGHRFFGKTVLHHVPEETVQEIDEAVDFCVAEAKLAFLGADAAQQGIPADLRVIAMDFDGVLTDNTVYVDQSGGETVRCHRGDGLGLSDLAKHGYEMLIVSKEKNPVVTARALKLGIPVHQGVDDKLPLLKQWLDQRGWSLAQTLYVGNDINDIDCLLAAGCGVAVADAHPKAVAAADVVLQCSGGRGALRELSDMILGTKESK